nr:hypothetical protein [Tanacetum cinerariifolium]
VTQFICDTLAPQLGETVLDPACGTGGFLTAAVETLKAQAKTVADQQQLQKVKGWEYKPLPFLLATTNLILHDVEPYATVATNLLFFTKGTPTKEIWYYQHRLPEGQKSYSKTKTIRRDEFQPIEAWWNNREESEVAWRVPVQTIIDRGYDLDIKNPHQAESVDEFSASELLEMLEASGNKFHMIIEDIKAAIIK